jgi:MarR family transcriptional regulator, transcriptional regulator for hemolysin
MDSKQAQELRDRNLGFVISDVHRLITAAVDKEVSSLGLTRSQLRVVLHLMRSDGISQVNLAEDLQLGKVTVGGLLDRLQEKGLIERRPHPSDRRSKLVYLTLADQNIYDSIVKAGRVILDQVLAGISKAEQQQLIDLLQRVKANTALVLRAGVAA